MASNLFTSAEQARYAHLIEAFKAERLGLPQPAPTYPSQPEEEPTP